MRFTHREQQVLQLLAQGMCNKTIGQQSPHGARPRVRHAAAYGLRQPCAVGPAFRATADPSPQHSGASHARLLAGAEATRANN